LVSLIAEFSIAAEDQKLTN